MCDHTNREAAMVRVRLKWSDAVVWCDPCLVPLVRALNDGGVPTVASCCGHGHRPGNIALADGRELVIARDFDEARRIDALFLIDINGESMLPGDGEAQGGWLRRHRHQWVALDAHHARQMLTGADLTVWLQRCSTCGRRRRVQDWGFWPLRNRASNNDTPAALDDVPETVLSGSSAREVGS